MKTLRLILIISIIGYCFTQTEEVDCGSIFEGLVKKKYEAMVSWSYNSISKECLKTHACTVGNVKTSSECKGIVPLILIQLNVSKKEQIAIKLLKNVLIGI